MVAIGAWLLLASLAGSLWVARAERRQRTALLAELTGEANLVAAHLRNARVDTEGFLRALGHTRDMEGIFRDPALKALMARPPARVPASRMAALPAVALLSHRLEEMAEDMEATLLFVVDTRGFCLASSDWRAPATALGDLFQDREYVQESLLNKVSESYLVGRHSKVLGSYFSVPVETDAGVTGSLVLKFSAPIWANHIGLSRTPVLVCNREGIVLFSNREAWNLTLLPGSPGIAVPLCQEDFGRPSLAPLPLRRVGCHELQDATGTRWLEGEVAVGASPLRVHLLLPAEPLQAKGRALWLRVAVIILLGWLILWGAERVWLRMVALRRLAWQDPLTQLLNRRGFENRANREWARAIRFKRPLALLALDLDHFKAVNDSFGHPAGDHVLRTLAAQCRELLRDMDILARMGGEEFSILLPETGLDQARVVAERIRKAVQELKITWEGRPVPVTLSIGLAMRGPGDTDLEEVLARADQALYRAKQTGRNRVAD